MKKMKLELLEAAAREATRNTLSAYPQFSNLDTEGRRSVRSGTEMRLCYELYIAKHRPQGAIDTRTSVDSYSGKILAVQVHQAACEMSCPTTDRRRNAAPVER
jgi:hypothetical protein